MHMFGSAAGSIAPRQAKAGGKAGGGHGVKSLPLLYASKASWQ